MTKLKQRTVEDGRQILSGWEKSGLSQQKFAKQLGISAAVVRYWVSRIRSLQKRKQDSAPVRFVEIVADRPRASAVPTTLELPGGLRLSTSDLPPPEYVAELSMACQRKLSC